MTEIGADLKYWKPKIIVVAQLEIVHLQLAHKAEDLKEPERPPNEATFYGVMHMPRNKRDARDHAFVRGCMARITFC